MKKTIALKLIVAAAFYLLTPLLADSPKELETLLAATYGAATTQAKKIATTIDSIYKTGTWNSLRYGDRIKLRHRKTGYYLLGSNKASGPQSASNPQKIVADKDLSSWWIVKGPHVDEQRFSGDFWKPVTRGSTLRLEQEGTGRNLHSQANVFNTPLPGTKDKKLLQTVNLFGDAGIGDINDNWKLSDIPGTKDAKIDIARGVPIKLMHVATNCRLNSDATRRFPDGQQEVACRQTITDDNDWWIIEDIVPGNAADLNIFYAAYGDLNNADAANTANITDKLDAMVYNGVLRFPEQATPPKEGSLSQGDAGIFKTLNIANPGSNTVKNIAILYGANSSLYLHLTPSEYDIIALPDFRDPKIVDLTTIATNPPDLKILYAIYGDLNHTPIAKNRGIGDTAGLIQNVTDKIQALIKNNQILFDTTPKAEVINSPTTSPDNLTAKKSLTKTPETPKTSDAKSPNASKNLDTSKPANTPKSANEKPTDSSKSTSSPKTQSSTVTDQNKALLIVYQAGTSIYVRIINEVESALISATSHNESTFIYTPPATINAPAQFTAEVGSAGRIAVGSSAGTLAVFALSTSKDTIQNYNTYNLTANPWSIIPVPTTKYPALQSFRDIGFSSDNIFCLLDSNGKAYRYDMAKQSLVQLPAGKGNESLSLDFIAVGNARNIWAVDTKSKTLYQYNINKWDKVPEQQSVYVAAAIDGTAVSINPTGEAFLYDGTKWHHLQGSKVDRVAIGNKSNIWGIRKGKLLVFTTGLWREVQGVNGSATSGFKEIALNAALTVFATTDDGKIYFKGEAGFFITSLKASKDGKKINITGSPVISRNMTRARAMKQKKLVVNPNAQTKTGKLAKLKSKKRK